MDPNANCAVHFFPDAFGFSGPRIFGRQSAGAGFLQALVQHGGLDNLYCCAPEEKSFAHFSAFVAQCGSAIPIHWIPYTNLTALATVGCLYQPDPHIASLSWHRRRLGSTAVSLCGVTHTLCTTGILDALGELAVAPIEPWDALVCTSQAGRAAVEHVLGTWHEYLRSRLNAEVRLSLEMPVIPLGVNCDLFEPSPSTSKLRADIRSQLGIAEDDIAVLYVGRLSYHAKAHPLPMYTALEEVARRTGASLHVLHFGWFSNQDLKTQFIQAAQRLCPSVRAHYLDERQDWSQSVWQAADIFMSLSDNIQETFGLTPVEAIAAGLPQVITDWDGYRDTVRNGIEGFRVPTVMPPAGAGDDLVARHSVGIDSYDQYVGSASQFVAVDVASCTGALERLVRNKELRFSMGQAGRKRARDVFDWRVIIKAYQSLWQELGARRKRAGEALGNAAKPHPLREDPFAVFSQYATCTLDANCVVDLGPNAGLTRLREIASLPMNTLAAHLMCSWEEIVALIEAITTESPVLVGDLLARIPVQRHSIVYRTLGWLTKMDAIRIMGLNASGLD